MTIHGIGGFSQSYILEEMLNAKIISEREYNRYDGIASPNFITVPQGKEKDTKNLLENTRWKHRIEE